MTVDAARQEQILDAAQAVGLHLLDRWRNVCLDLGLTYHLGGGTLLAAVRDQAFIPWDDDVDVTIPRADFERLLTAHRLDPALFGEDCHLDDGIDDARFPRLLYLPSSSDGQPLSLDIFVLDAVPRRRALRLLTGWLLWVTTLAFWLSGTGTVDSEHRRLQAVLAALARAAGARRCFRAHRWAVAVNRRFSDPTTWDIVVGRNPIGRTRPSQWYRGDRMATFEGVRHPVPTEAEAILRMLYGPDFMTPRPASRPAHARTPLRVELDGRSWDIP